MPKKANSFAKAANIAVEIGSSKNKKKILSSKKSKGVKSKSSSKSTSSTLEIKKTVVETENISSAPVEEKKEVVEVFVGEGSKEEFALKEDKKNEIIELFGGAGVVIVLVELVVIVGLFILVLLFK